MKISAIACHTVWTNHERSWLLLEVCCDDGSVGFGEASQSRNDHGVIAEINRLSANYIGHDPCDLIERRQALLDWPYSGRTLFSAISALEQALWDLMGKHLRVPVYQLLGGSVTDSLRTYANIGYAADAHDPESLFGAARDAVRSGYDAIKFYPFGTRPHAASAAQRRRWISEGVEKVRGVRAAVGDQVDVLIDLMHQFHDFVEMRDIARALDSCNLYWIEDPFVHDDPLQMAELRQAIGPRLAGGAPLTTRHQWRPLLEAHAMDVIMPDVKWMGGISQVKKLAAMADVYGAMVSPHNASGPVATAASVHVGFSLSNFAILEYPWGVPEWRGALTRNSERIVQGSFRLPDAPGLGIDLDLDIARAHATQPVASRLAGVALPVH